MFTFPTAPPETREPLTLTADTVDDITALAGLETRRVTGTYSGRYMYGAQCLAVYGTERHLLHFVIAARDVCDDALDQLAEPVRDNWGKEFVYYWPHVTVEEEQ